MRSTAERSRIAPALGRAGSKSESAVDSSAALKATVQSPARDSTSPSAPTSRVTDGAADTWPPITALPAALIADAPPLSRRGRRRRLAGAGSGRRDQDANKAGT